MSCKTLMKNLKSVLLLSACRCQSSNRVLVEFSWKSNEPPDSGAAGGESKLLRKRR